MFIISWWLVQLQKDESLKRKQTKLNNQEYIIEKWGKKRKAKEEKRAGNCIDKSCVIHDEYKK